VLAVPHALYRSTTADRYLRLLADPARGVFMDLRKTIPSAVFEQAGTRYWSL
jgi:hypothetical protein